MKKLIYGIVAGAFLAALCIVGAVERGADVRAMWWTLPLIAVMAVAEEILETAEMKKFLAERYKSASRWQR